VPAGVGAPPLACPVPCEAPACGPKCWLNADGLLWWIKDAPLPTPLVTTGPFNPNAVQAATLPPASLRTPGTTILYGGNDVVFDVFPGGRLNGGMTFDPNGILGADASGFFLWQRASQYSARSDTAGQPFLGRPILSAVSGLENVAAIALPNDARGFNGGVIGGIAIRSTARLWGADGDLSALVVGNQTWSANVLVGFRYLNLQETLTIDEGFTPLGRPLVGAFNGGTVGLGQTVSVADLFRTNNQFYGGQVGGRFAYNAGPLTAELVTKVAFGVTHEHIDIAGNSVLNGPGVTPMVVPGGLLAGLSNSGSYGPRPYALVSETGVNVGYQVTEQVRVRVGGTFLYWSSVARPGDQIDRTVDQRTVPTLQTFVPGLNSLSPMPRLDQAQFWAGGVNAGLEFRF
jgi:hypothetical protein